MPVSLEQRLSGFRQQLDSLPEAKEPPPTTLQVLGRSRLEGDWQRILFHFLQSEANHGLDRHLLEHILTAVADRDDLNFSFSRFDLDEVRVETEVFTSNDRRADAVVWSSDEWFICWELKVDAPEGDGKTEDYVDATSFESIDLDKEAVPADGHHYIFLAPKSTPPPTADEFVSVSWEWMASELQSFLEDSDGGYPLRTTIQLDDFISTIRSELQMTTYEENQQEKTELYLDYYEEIADVQEAFEDAWTEFADSWGVKLAGAMDAATLVEDSTVPAEYADVELWLENDEERRWTFRQGHQDWSWLFPRNWWTSLADGSPIFDPTSPQARIGFLHRLEWHQDDALRNHELIFYLRNAPSNHDDFYKEFANRFNTDAEIPDRLPRRTTRPEVKSNVLEATYDINVEHHEDFFSAYTDALATAVEDHIVSNPALIHRIDDIYAASM